MKADPTTAKFLPYSRQSIDADDIAAVVAALRSDFLTTGPLVDQFEFCVRRSRRRPEPDCVQLGHQRASSRLARP